MSKTIARSLRFPVALIALAIVAVVLSPVLFASAAEGDGEGPTHEQRRPLHHPMGEVVEVDTEANTILVAPARIPQDAEEVKYVLVSYTDDTEMKEDGEEATESDITVGDKIHFRGEHNLDSEEYVAEVSAEFITLFDETEPPFPPRHGFPRIGEVVEVDTDANTILVKGLRQNKDGEDVYVWVTYSDDTVINEDGTETDESAISVGDKIQARGEVNTDSAEYLAEVDADHIRLFDEKEPNRIGHRIGQFHGEPQQEIEE